MTPILLTNLLATWAMVGVIWTVHVVHYPLMAHTGPEHSAAYQRRHVKQISLLVGPLMIVEAIAAAALFTAAPGFASLVSLILLAAIWGITGVLSVPAHDRLQDGYQREPFAVLMRSNAARTALWTLRGVLVASLVVS